MDKIVAVLEYIEDEAKTRDEINQYCRKIDLNPRHAWDVLTDPANPLVIENDSMIRPNLKGHQMVARHRKEELTVTLNDNSDTDIRDSNNVAIIKGGSGHTIIQHSQTEQKPIDVSPYTDDEYGLIKIGKWIMLRIFGTLNHDMRLFTAATSLIALAAGGVTFAPFVPNSPYTVNSPNFAVVEFAGIIALSAALYLGVIVRVSQQTKCPNCGTRFSWTRKKRVLKDSRNLPEKEVRNYESTYSCDNPTCGYTEENVREVEEIDKSPDSD